MAELPGGSSFGGSQEPMTVFGGGMISAYLIDGVIDGVLAKLAIFVLYVGWKRVL